MVSIGKTCRRQDNFVIHDRPVQHAWSQPTKCHWLIKNAQGSQGRTLRRRTPGSSVFLCHSAPRRAAALCSLTAGSALHLGVPFALELFCWGAFQTAGWWLLGMLTCGQVASDSPHSPSFSSAASTFFTGYCVQQGSSGKVAATPFTSSLMMELFCYC